MNENLEIIQKIRADISEEIPIIYETVKEKKPKIILECGCGASTLAMALALKDAACYSSKIVAIDTDLNAINAIINNQKLYYWLSDFIILINGRSVDFLKTFIGTTDFVFIDSDHSYSNTLEELNLSDSKLPKNGIIMMHDTRQEGVSIAIKEFNKDNRYIVNTYETTNGCTKLTKSGPL